LNSSNPITREGANVVVLNATDTTGVASKASSALKAKGVIVSATSDADATQAKSSIVDLSDGKMPGTKQLLESLYGTTVVSKSSYATAYPDADFILLVGTDHVNPPTTATTSTKKQ
jgi:hypothetical protein